MRRRIEISWLRVASGIIVGMFFVGLVFGIWYYYAIFLPAQKITDEVVKGRQIEAEFRKRYCKAETYPNEFVRKICTGKVAW